MTARHKRLLLGVWLLVAVPAGRLDAGGASITLQPVPPKTVPPSDYPPGTIITGQEIILGSVPARVWLEIHATGWEPLCKKPQPFAPAV